MRDRPTLRDDCQGYYNTFDVICDTRGYSEAGVQPLRISEVAAYLTELGISGGERRSKFLHLLLEMDRAYMAHQFEKRNSETAKK